MKFTHPKHKVHLKGVVWNKDESKAKVVIVNSEKALELDCLGEFVTIPLNALQFMDVTSFFSLKTIFYITSIDKFFKFGY